MAPTKGIFSNIVNNVKGFFNNPSYNEEAATKTDGDLFKAYIPNFLYKPPYGYPRMVDIPRLRDLGKTPYVFMVTTTIIDEVCSVPWDVVPKENDEPDEDNMGEEPKDKSQILTHIKEVKELFNNPNGNEESFEFILRQVLRDILELDSGVIVKVFDKAGKLSQLLVVMAELSSKTLIFLVTLVTEQSLFRLSISMERPRTRLGVIMIIILGLTLLTSSMVGLLERCLYLLVVARLFGLVVTRELTVFMVVAL